ncbi:MAG TPA: hypothetical protein PLU94_05815 [Methanoregulaceae archaeon]|nr:hypothetical protein [Methanoregulaceae archaeon]HPM61306.1 hypothetical protein [Methanoregulaceae archaeon]
MNHDRDGTRKGTDGSLSWMHALKKWHDTRRATGRPDEKCRVRVISTAADRYPGNHEA